jgi:hypothetical protein
LNPDCLLPPHVFFILEQHLCCSSIKLIAGLCPEACY